MNIFQILLWPFTTLITKVFEFSFFLTGNYGISLILVSFFITLITAPLYILADKWKAEELTLKNKMAHSLQSINTHYTGSKKFYLTKTLQKIWGYTGLHSFKTSFGLILQIPFFFGAYEALTHYTGYQGVGFLFLQDLSKADSLFFGFSLMPFIMTLVNILSAAYYSRSFSWHKNKSLYIMAAVFLVLLYKSPSALLVYWTMNNVFSILKTFVLKKLGLSVGTVEAVQVRKEKNIGFYIQNFLKTNTDFLPLFIFILFMSLGVYLSSRIQYTFFAVLVFLSSIFTAFSFVLAIIKKDKKLLILYAFFSPVILILFYVFLKSGRDNPHISMSNFALLIEFSILLLGFISYLKLFFKPKEQSTIANRMGKKNFALNNCIIAGAYAFYVFIFQPVKIYLTGPKDIGLSLSFYLLFSGLITAIVLALIVLALKVKNKNIQFYFSNALIYIFLSSIIFSSLLMIQAGTLDGFSFQYTEEITLMPLWRYLLNPFIVIGLFYFARFLLIKKQELLKNISIIFILVLSINIIYAIRHTQKELFVDTKLLSQSDELPKDAFDNLVFSTTKQNVVYLIVDNLNGNYLSRLIKEDSSYIEKFDGFSYYPDCLSLGNHTIVSLRGMFGGEQYSPLALQNNGLTGDEEMKQVSDEFFQTVKNNNYRATIINPSYFYPKSNESTRVVHSSSYRNYWMKKNNVKEIKSTVDMKFFPLLVSLFHSASWQLKYPIYDRDAWLVFNKGLAVARSNAMANLVYIDLMADFIQSTEESSGLFMFYHCDLPHTPFAINKDGNLIDEGYPEPSIPSFYNAPAAYYTAKKTFDLILDFTDALKKQNLYDNTIIVIASDHGNPYFDNDINIKEKSVMQNVDYSRAQTLFLVKGINEKGPLQTRDDLVSSADILSYLYSSGAFIKDVDILDFPPTKREERIYSCLAVSYADLVEKDSVPYRSYSVKGPLADINSWTAKEKE